MNSFNKLTIGIDASRNRSGGARAHIIGIIDKFDIDFLNNDIKEVHIWSYPELLECLPDKEWLIKHNPYQLNQSIYSQLWWQYRILPIEARNNKIDVLLNTDAGTICRYKPSVTMSRDMLSYEKGEMSRYGISRQRIRLELLKLFQNTSLRKSSAAIFLTDYASTTIQKSTGRIRNYKIIPHGVSDCFKLETNNGKWEDNVKKQIKCVYVSNIDLYKHQWNVAIAISKLYKKGYNISIDFIGGGHGRAKKKFDNIISNLKDTNYIIQHEFIPNSNLPNEMKNKDIIIFASSCENMPNTLIEGMSMGLPIACSDRGPMPEILKNGGVYFDPENIDSIETAIESIINNPEERERIAKTAKQLSSYYSWERCSRETFNYLIKIARTEKY